MSELLKELKIMRQSFLESDWRAVVILDDVIKLVETQQPQLNENQHIDIKAIEQLLAKSKADLDIEDILGTTLKDIEELDVDVADALMDYGDVIISAVIGALETRLAFMKAKTERSE